MAKKKTPTKRRGRPPKKKAAPKRGELLEADEPKALTLATLAEQWPDLATQFAHQLSACVQDCRSRPLTTAKRTIAITIDLKPDDGDAVVQAKSKLTLPLSRLEPTPLKIGAGNQLLLGFAGERDGDLLDDEPDDGGGDFIDDEWPDDGP